MDISKKQWWIVGIVVPIIVAIIAIVPKFIKNKDSGTIYVSTVGNQFTGDVAFNTVNIIMDQARQLLGKDLPEDLITKLDQASKSVESNNFHKAIPLLESVASSVPIPSIFNNIGAAYLAAGNNEMAKSYFEKALSKTPDDKTASFNLSQTDSKASHASTDKPENETPKVQKSAETAYNEHEPNNIAANANSFPFGTKVAAEISDGEDIDYYKFRNTSHLRDFVAVSLINKSATLAPYIQVYDHKKAYMNKYYNDTQQADLDFSFTAEPGKDYYFSVHHHYGSGKYILSVKSQIAYDQFEPNDRANSAALIRLNQPIIGSILDEHDVDWYKVSGLTSTQLDVRFENLSMTLAPYIQVYDHKKAYMNKYYNDTQQADLDFSFTAEPGKDYYFSVHHHYGSGKYKLTILEGTQ